MKFIAFLLTLITFNVYAQCDTSASDSGINTLVTDGCNATDPSHRTIILDRQIKGGADGEEIKSSSLNLKFQALNEEIKALNPAPASTAYYSNDFSSDFAAYESGGAGFLDTTNKKLDLANNYMEDFVDPTMSYYEDAIFELTIENGTNNDYKTLAKSEEALDLSQATTGIEIKFEIDNLALNGAANVNTNITFNGTDGSGNPISDSFTGKIVITEDKVYTAQIPKTDFNNLTGEIKQVQIIFFSDGASYSLTGKNGQPLEIGTY